MTDEQRISDKVKALQEVTNLKLSYCRTLSKFKIVDERGRDVLGTGWQDAYATLCHIDTAITFTLINTGFEKTRVGVGGTQSAGS